MALAVLTNRRGSAQYLPLRPLCSLPRHERKTATEVRAPKTSAFLLRDPDYYVMIPDVWRDVQLCLGEVALRKRSARHTADSVVWNRLQGVYSCHPVGSYGQNQRGACVPSINFRHSTLGSCVPIGRRQVAAESFCQHRFCNSGAAARHYRDIAQIDDQRVRLGGTSAPVHAFDNAARYEQPHQESLPRLDDGIPRRIAPARLPVLMNSALAQLSELLSAVKAAGGNAFHAAILVLSGSAA